MVDRRVVVGDRAGRDQLAAGLLEPVDDGLRGGGPVVVGEVEEQERGVRGAGDLGDEVLVVVRGDRRQVDELNADVLVVHHAGDGLAGGERVRGDRRGGLRQPRDEPRLAGVRRAEEHDLPGALPGDLVDAGGRLLRAGPGVLDLVVQLADLRLERRLDLLAGLVLGQEHPHFLEGGELLLGGAGLLVAGLGVVVLRRQVDGHDVP